MANAQTTVDRGTEKSNAVRESIVSARTTVAECETIVIDSRANQSLTELTKAIKKERSAAKQRELVLKVLAIGATIYAASK